jgi:hypothetical protein
MINVLLALKSLNVKYNDSGEGKWIDVICPWHNGDSLGSGTGVARDSGAFNCEKCGAKGSLETFLGASTGQPVSTIERYIKDVSGSLDTELDETLVQAFALALMQHPQSLATLHKKGIGLNEITKYKLGYNPTAHRITIPIYSGATVCGLKQYYPEPRPKSEPKYKNWKGTRNSLYLVECLKDTTDVFITEGEFKAQLLASRGFPAVSPTNGAKGWDKTWNELCAGKNVFIVFDVNDKLDTGRKASLQLAVQLQHVAASLKVITLPLGDKYIGGDVTNYFIDEEKTAEDFRQLCIATPYYRAPEVPADEVSDTTTHEVSFDKCSRGGYNNKRVQTRVVVTALGEEVYSVPRTAKVKCHADQKYCFQCHVQENKGYEFSIAADSTQTLRFAEESEDIRNEELFKVSGIYERCKASTIEVTAWRSVEVLRVLPELLPGSPINQSAATNIFYTGAEQLVCNTTYEIAGRAVPSPKDSVTTVVVDAVRETKDNISAFELSKDLTLFQPAAWTLSALRAKVDDICEDLSANVTMIYERQHLHIMMDLCWHSVLNFNFNGSRDVRGWADILVIGDSGQGKSETALRLNKHYIHGDVVDCKGASAAGLIGAVTQHGKHWLLTWGAVPLNDRRLLVLEEAKGIPSEVLQKLTQVRSSGQAQVQKARSGATHARTRLLWISNPRAARKMGEYQYGVHAVRELMGSPEDVRRFDAVLAVRADDVESGVVNRTSAASTVPHYYTSELCSHLVGWSWSRNTAHIEFDADAVEAILLASQRMGDTYSNVIPIVEPADQRLKIARLSCAIAARTFSTDDGDVLRVRLCHVQFIEWYLNEVYSSEALGYLKFSLSRGKEAKLEDVNAVIETVSRLPNAKTCAELLSSYENVTAQDIANITEYNREGAEKVIGDLVRLGAVIKHGRDGYRKTFAFSKVLTGLTNLNDETYAQQLERRGL